MRNLSQAARKVHSDRATGVDGSGHREAFSDGDVSNQSTTAIRVMTLFAQTMSRAEFCRVLERCGYPNDEVEQIAAQLPDPIDVHRDAPILEHYGVTLDHLTDLMGGSPA